MIIDRAQGRISRALQAAGRAPSVHNSQPWQFELGEDAIHLLANRDRQLPTTDAEGRDLLLSCGAALHHLRAALAAEGLETAVERFPDPDQTDLLAVVQVGAGDQVDAELARVIPRRRSDRRPFVHQPIPDDQLGELQAAAARHGAEVMVVTSRWHRALLESTFREAAALQAALGGYAEELDRWTSRTGEDGIPPSNLPTEQPESVQAARRFRPGQLPVDDTVRSEGATLLLLGTDSDDQVSRLRAGEALSAVLLQATSLGLASCPLSQPLEVESTWETVRDQILGGRLSPQVVVRVGWPSSDDAVAATPRRPVSKTVGRSPR